MLAVAAGAFGAHVLRGRLEPQMLVTYEIAVRYQMYHALGMILLGLLILWRPGHTLLEGTGWLFLLGTLIFSGSLYALTLSGIRWLGAITPIGGIAFMAGWLCIAIACLRSGS